MRVSRQAAIAAFAFAGVACHSDLAPPANAVVGRFGGRGIEIIATASRIRVRFPCSMAEFSRPLIPTPIGTFAGAAHTGAGPRGNGRSRSARYGNGRRTCTRCCVALAQWRDTCATLRCAARQRS